MVLLSTSFKPALVVPSCWLLVRVLAEEEKAVLLKVWELVSVSFQDIVPADWSTTLLRL